MPGRGQPSVVVTFSSESSTRVVVTAPFSDIPQADSTAAPRARRALATSGRGIGAPAETKIRKDGVVVPVAMQKSARSLRNGVAPIVNVARSARDLLGHRLGDEDVLQHRSGAEDRRQYEAVHEAELVGHRRWHVDDVVLA